MTFLSVVLFHNPFTLICKNDLPKNDVHMEFEL